LTFIYLSTIEKGKNIVMKLGVFKLSLIIIFLTHL